MLNKFIEDLAWYAKCCDLVQGKQANAPGISLL